jgi:hypothetical protein
MFTRQNLVRLLLAGLLLALLAVPVLGAALDSGVAANDGFDSILIFNTGPTESSGVEIVCIPGDPTGGQGGGC